MGGSDVQVLCVRTLLESHPPDVWIDTQSLECAPGALASSSWLDTAAIPSHIKELHEKVHCDSQTILEYHVSVNVIADVVAALPSVNVQLSQALSRLNPDFLGSDDQLLADEPLGGCAYAGKTFGCLAFSIALPLVTRNPTVTTLTAGRFRRLGSSMVDAL